MHASSANKYDCTSLSCVWWARHTYMHACCLLCVEAVLTQMSEAQYATLCNVAKHMYCGVVCCAWNMYLQSWLKLVHV